MKSTNSKAGSGVCSQLDVQMLRGERRQGVENATRMATVFWSVPALEAIVLRCLVGRLVVQTRPFQKAARRCPEHEKPSGAADSGF